MKSDATANEGIDSVTTHAKNESEARVAVAPLVSLVGGVVAAAVRNTQVPSPPSGECAPDGQRNRQNGSIGAVSAPGGHAQVVGVGRPTPQGCTVQLPVAALRCHRPAHTHRSPSALRCES